MSSTSQHNEVEISVVVPCHNEAGNLAQLIDRLTPVLEKACASYEILFVDDGSRDETLRVAHGLAASEPRLGVLALSRNFGKEHAICAGLDHARGRAVVLIDADLQHPPEMISTLIDAWRAGNEVVHAVQRVRPNEPLFKRVGVRGFYRLLDALSETKLPKGVGDFCLLDRKAVDALTAMPERARFMKGLYFWIGFRQMQIPYDPQPRHHGDSAWSLVKLVGLALNGITAFSTIPLRLAGVLGLTVSVVAAIYAVVLVVRLVLHGVDTPGYASLMVGLLFLGGVQLVCIGILGEYIGRIFNETKRRPLYLVAEFRKPRDGDEA